MLKQVFIPTKPGLGLKKLIPLYLFLKTMTNVNKINSI